MGNVNQKTNWYFVTTMISVLIAITVSLTSLVHSNEVQKIKECKDTATTALTTANTNGTNIAVIRAGLNDMERRLAAIERKQDRQADVSRKILRAVQGR